MDLWLHDGSPTNPYRCDGILWFRQHLHLSTTFCPMGMQHANQFAHFDRNNSPRPIEAHHANDTFQPICPMHSTDLAAQHIHCSSLFYRCCTDAIWLTSPGCRWQWLIFHHRSCHLLVDLKINTANEFCFSFGKCEKMERKKENNKQTNADELFTILFDLIFAASTFKRNITH